MRKLIPFLLLVCGCSSDAPTPAESASSPIVCQIFMMTDCPLCNAYAPELRRLGEEYQPRGVEFQMVYAMPDATLETVQLHASEYQLPGTIRHDANLTLARAAEVKRVPEVVVWHGLQKVYQGRIDDRYPRAGGKRREQITAPDLRNALDALLSGQPVPTPRTIAVGCLIDFHSPMLP